MDQHPKQVMFDIETLSLSTHNALILSMGAMEFELFEAGPWFGRMLLIPCDIPQQLLAGREVSAQTVAFWRAQSEKAQEHWALPYTPPARADEALGRLAGFVSEAAEVWANGVVFDHGNVHGLADQFNLPAPWHYRAPRDLRTITRTFPRRREKPADLQFTPHDPMDDCRLQIWMLWEHWPAVLTDAERQST
jgi:hypothetical protein